MIPKILVREALKQHAVIGREYDLSGNHVAYYLQVSSEWRVYRHSIPGMLALLRMQKKTRKPGP